MKIFDLTRGKYPQLYDGNDFTYKYEEAFVRVEYGCDSFQRLFHGAGCQKDMSSVINSVPIFLVDTSMAHEYVSVPGCQCSVKVPADTYVTTDEDVESFDIDEWVNKKEADRKEDPRERLSKPFVISDLLGVYVSTGNDDVLPRRIFVWMDKINNYKDASTLFHLVVYHELGHALMDVEMYGILPSPNFTYSNDYVYRFIEEAYANAIALTVVYMQLTPSEQSSIESFVNGQGAGYSEGMNLFRTLMNVDQWMALKVLFNYDIAGMLRDCWKNNHHELVPKCVESVGRKGWQALKNRHDKWCIIELPSQRRVDGFKEYDSFWSFDDNGLCMVRLDQQSGYLYGYVNEHGVEQIPVVYEHVYSFDNGIAIAKKDGQYGAIDLNNNIVIPFNLPYDDVRGFRDGRASVKDANGKWGVINTKGELIVPCENDNIVL